MIAVVVAILTKLVSILNLGLRRISKRIRMSTCFDSYISLCFKVNDKADSKLDLKIKEALHINWRKAGLNAQ